MSTNKHQATCPHARQCGACQFSAISYESQLAIKQLRLSELLGKFAKVSPIIGMESPTGYRCKVHHSFAFDKRKGIISGLYEARSHRVVNVDGCLLDEPEALAIIKYIRSICKSFKIKAYDEDTGTGFLRHILVRKGYQTGEIMVTLVVSSFIFPGKNNFVRVLREHFTNITTIVLNKNDGRTSMVLGEEEKVIYGSGYICDKIMGNTFRISSRAFYQVNPAQTEILYKVAIELADIKLSERVIDAYCGTGTIGLCAAASAKSVVGIELNRDAVRDAVANMHANHIKNAVFVTADASDYMNYYADEGAKADVVFMDPPRSGSTERFIDAVCKISPSRVVYVSCGPDTLERDLKYFTSKGYKVREIQPVDMFPYTEHIETVVLLSK